MILHVKAVFISYATPDREAADEVCADLEADGIECWIAPRDVRASEDYAEAITAAIGSCHLLLLLFSDAAAASEHVEREVHLAASAKAAVLPIRLEPTTPEGAFKYLLANTQYLDAFPRLAPQLSTVRDEVRRLLAARGGKPLPVIARRSPFQRILSIVAAWAVVFAFDALLVTWMQRDWFNLVTLSRVPLAAISAPGPLALLLVGPVIALAAQYWTHRSPQHIVTLDALFGITHGAGPRLRLFVAAGLCAVVGAAIPLAPPAVQVHLVNGPIDSGEDSASSSRGVQETHTPVRRPLQSSSYPTQTTSHYAVEVHIGAFNPPGPYILRTELAPYATGDGVEFGEIWVDRDLNITNLTPIAEHEKSLVHVDLEIQERMKRQHLVLFNVRHYRDSEPSSRAAITASLSLGSVEHHDVEPVAVSFE